jgi:phage terminase large subunit-like protein
MGQQELYARILDDNPGALWTRDLIEDHRVPDDKFADPELFRRVVVAIDPAVSFDSEGDETGMVVAGVGLDGMGYVLEDLSGHYKPDQWAKTAITAFYKWEADRIIAEVNQGGDMVENTIRVMDDTIPYRPVRAVKGKLLRAEPVAALYERKLVRHWGVFDKLEDQMCTWTPGLEDSPDRLDALVYALTDLMVTGPQPVRLYDIHSDPGLVKASYWRKDW